jgi:hypothetical protein
MSMLKPFFEYCVANEWMIRSPARAVKNPKGRDIEKAEQRLPFSDEELKSMYDACRSMATRPCTNGPAKYSPAAAGARRDYCRASSTAACHSDSGSPVRRGWVLRN